jgi:hypothetical protein
MLYMYGFTTSSVSHCFLKALAVGGVWVKGVHSSFWDFDKNRGNI